LDGEDGAERATKNEEGLVTDIGIGGGGRRDRGRTLFTCQEEGK
jgi:hypothetical protein